MDHVQHKFLFAMGLAAFLFNAAVFAAAWFAPEPEVAEGPLDLPRPLSPPEKVVHLGFMCDFVVFGLGALLAVWALPVALIQFWKKEISAFQLSLGLLGFVLLAASFLFWLFPLMSFVEENYTFY